MKPFRSYFLRGQSSGAYTLSDAFVAPSPVVLVGVQLSIATYDLNDGNVTIAYLVSQAYATSAVPPSSGANVLAALQEFTMFSSAAGYLHSSQSIWMPLSHKMAAGERVWIYGGSSGTTGAFCAVIQYV